MAAQVVIIQLDPGTPTLGIWCNACMTSGGYLVPLNRITNHCVTTIATGYGCLTCEGPGDLQP